MKPMAGFCWIASYPKSGNTWVRLLLANLMAQGRPLDLSQPIGFAPSAASASELELMLDVEVSELTPAEQRELRPDLYRTVAHDAPGPRFRKVHDAWGHTPAGRPLFPPDCTLASVYIVRDPRDVAVSWAHHSALTLDASVAFLGDEDATMARATRWKDQLAQHLGTWSTHVASWLGATPAPLVVSYERLSADPLTVLAAIAAHCQIEASAAAVADAVAAMQFNRLQQVERGRRFDLGQADGRPFFRKGIAGDWRTVLGPAQVDRIQQDHRPMMDLLGYA